MCNQTIALSVLSTCSPITMVYLDLWYFIFMIILDGDGGWVTVYYKSLCGTIDKVVLPGNQLLCQHHWMYWVYQCPKSYDEGLAVATHQLLSVREPCIQSVGNGFTHGRALGPVYALCWYVICYILPWHELLLIATHVTMAACLMPRVSW